MQDLVKNAAALDFNPEQLQILESRAHLHRRYSSIEFKILEADATHIVVRITQDKSFTGNYFDTKRLVEIAHETFDDLANGRAVHARPVPYQIPPTNVVTSDWIKKKVQESGKKIKEISHELGVDANTISAYKNGSKPLSGVVQAMFYYYFQHK